MLDGGDDGAQPEDVQRIGDQQQRPGDPQARREEAGDKGRCGNRPGNRGELCVPAAVEVAEAVSEPAACEHAGAPTDEHDRAHKLAALDQALAIDPDNFRARYHKGVVNRLLKRFDVAIELLKPVVDAYPRFRQARQELGYAYYVTQRYQLAREQFEALQAINPDDITANNYLSYIYAKLGMKEKALEQATLFADRKEDVEVEPLAQDFWSKNESVADELAPFHVHDLQAVHSAAHNSASIGR